MPRRVRLRHAIAKGNAKEPVAKAPAPYLARCRCAAIYARALPTEQSTNAPLRKKISAEQMASHLLLPAAIQPLVDRRAQCGQ